MTFTSSIESAPTTSPSVESDEISYDKLSPEATAFAARVYKAFEKTMSIRDRLSCLYQIDTEQFEEEVEEQVDDYLNNDPEYQEIHSQLRNERRYGADKGASFIPILKERRSKARELILTSLNLSETSTDEFEAINESKNNVDELLQDISNKPENINTALIALGCKAKRDDESGEYTYSYPYDLFPESVNERWRDYLDTVKRHEESRYDLSPETETERSTADTLRKTAHDVITGKVDGILRLERFGWDTIQTRRLLAKMRDDELSIPGNHHRNHSHKTKEQIAVSDKLAQHTFHH